MLSDKKLRKSRAEVPGREIPFTFSQQQYPLNPGATIAFTLEDRQEVTLIIYDSFGRVVHVLYDKALLNVGYHELKLYGTVFPPGGCYARLETRYGVQQRTLIVSAGTI